ncbi:alpha-N-acetylglucosaminidase-like isoform X2 [Lineus longissimus]|uniref:alpha-N-acetylglucosaminidase-like isoform X2 n=1 Tax=Lineus longissimus TaxID=88925 RepID=UPI00315E01C5
MWRGKMLIRLVRLVGLLVVLLQYSQAADFQSLDHLKSSTPPSVQERTVADLIKRILPTRAAFEFTVEIAPDLGPPNRDTFQLTNYNGGIKIKANSGVGGAWGFHYYLTQFCGGHIAWEGRQLNIPTRLPRIPNGKLQVTTNDRFRYYANVCTVSYSYVWWNWTRWEQHLDWMALNAINLPLAFTGQEAIWQRVYLKLGFTQDDLDSHFGGPAFLAWSRMGNMKGWGGPLPPSWYAGQLALQHKILDRMRRFGMVPVLPGFAGHVPGAIKRVFPNATVTQLKDWGHMNSTYCCTSLLDPEDPLFRQIGKLFIEEMMNEFGTDHVYNADTFNEMTPPSSEPSYLKKVGKAVYDGMTVADPQAIWLIQGWSFERSRFWQPSQLKAFVTSVPKGKMIVLDLMAEAFAVYNKTASFYGQPFIWCMLHNFGGNLGLHGMIDSINKGPIVARKNTTMIGIGLAMEGIFQNYMIYEFMLENTWRQEERNISQWMGEYARRRYNTHNSHLKNMWTILAMSVYNDSSLVARHLFHIITRRPSLSLKPLLWYDPDSLFKVWNIVVHNARRHSNSALYRYDLVDITRQCLQVLGIFRYMGIMTAYRDRDVEAIKEAGQNMSELLDDLDSILGSDAHWLLGSWLEEAASLGTNAKEKQLYTYNAKNQITLWGPEGNILDYATKQWSGVVSRYYKPRWQLFVQALLASVIEHKKFNNTEFKSAVLESVEKPWTFDAVPYSTQPQGDTIKIATYLHRTYRSLTHSQLTRKFYANLPMLCQNRKICARNSGKWLSKEIRRRRRRKRSKTHSD